jgi:hypothetical protein
VSGTAASAVLKASRARALWQGGEGSPWLLGGLSVRIEVEKHRRRLPGQSEGLALTVAEAPPAPVPRVAEPPAQKRDEHPVIWEPLRAVGGG